MPSKTESQMEDVYSLTDDELASRLRSLGSVVGPIIDTTRRVYQRKLEKLLKQANMAEPEPEEPSDEEEDYSDEDETDATQTYQSSVRQQVEHRDTAFQQQEVRRRPVPQSAPARPASGSASRTTRYTRIERENEEESDEEEEEVVETKTNNYRTAPRISPDDIVTQAERPKTEQPQAKRGLSIWLQLAILIVVAIVIFLIIHNLEPAGKSHIGKIDQSV